MNDCTECGASDCDPEFMPCCHAWLCDRCADAHDEKHETP